MKIKPLFLAIATAGIMAMASSAHASPLLKPYVFVKIADEDSITYQSKDFTSGSNWTADTTNPAMMNLVGTKFWQAADLDGTKALFNISSLSFDADPELNFSITATNNTTKAKTYSFSYNTPLDPNLTGAIISHAELNGTLNDLGGIAGASVKPVTGTPFLLTSFDLDVNGDAISKNVDVGTAFTTIGLLQTFVSDSTLNCTIACETMSAVLTFTLSKGDSVTFTGKVTQVSAVPVPGAAWLFGSALAGLMGFRRKQQKV